jgi:glycosyltransferase involved in cell wall biosynthesis
MIAYTFYETDNRVRRYAESLAARGHAVHVIVLRRPHQPRFEIVKGVALYRIQTRRVSETFALEYLIKLLWFLLNSTLTATLLYFNYRFKVFHIHSIPDFLVFSTLLIRPFGIKVVLDIHDIVPELYASKFRCTSTSCLFRCLLQMEQLACLYADRVVVANDIWRDRLAVRVGPNDHFTTILNYPDTTLFRAEPESPVINEPLRILYPGTLSWHQGVDLLVEAVALLRANNVTVSLTIVGDGAERERLHKQIELHSLEEHVMMMEGVPAEAVAHLMKATDVGVEPKRKESFANEALSTKIFEFMAAGVPVIASDTMAHKRYFNDSSVIFFKSGDVIDLADKILCLANTPRKRSDLRQNGLELVREINWPKKQGFYFSMIDDLVDAG